MASAGPITLSSGEINSSVGTYTWTNDSNGLNSSAAIVNALSGSGYPPMTAAGPGPTYYIVSYFNFSGLIPSGATIDGIAFRVSRMDVYGRTIQDTHVRAVKGGVLSSTNLADTVTNWPGSYAYKTYGGSTSLLGETWLDTDLVSGFGLAFACSQQGRVDHVDCTVYYTEGSSGPPLPVFIHHYRQQGFMRHRQPDLLLPPSVQSQSTVRPFNWSLSV